jgi:glutathione S-transferase
MKFYDCLSAPSPRRVRIFLAEKGVKEELSTIQVNLGAGEHLGDAFGLINPHRTVPVLELDDGTRLLDSNSICLYLDEMFPEINLTGRDPKERAVIAMWQRELDLNGLGAVAECFRNSAKSLRNRALTGPANYEQIPALAERGRLRIRHFFSSLNSTLQDSEFVAGHRFTVADITAFVAVEFARLVKESVPDEATHLMRWREAIRSRPSSNA